MALYFFVKIYFIIKVEANHPLLRDDCIKKQDIDSWAVCKAAHWGSIKKGLTPYQSVMISLVFARVLLSFKR